MFPIDFIQHRSQLTERHPFGELFDLYVVLWIFEHFRVTALFSIIALRIRYG